MPGSAKATSDRDRIRAALTAIVAERGYRDTTLDAVLGGAFAAAGDWRDGLRAAAWAYSSAASRIPMPPTYPGRVNATVLAGNRAFKTDAASYREN